MGVLSPLLEGLGKGLLKSQAAYWAPWAGLTAYAIGKLGEEKSREYYRQMYGRDQAATGWSVLTTMGPVLGAVAYLGAGFGAYKGAFGKVASAAEKATESIGAATKQAVKETLAPGAPRAAAPWFRKAARVAAFPVTAPARLAAKHPYWTLYGLGATSLSAYSFANVPQAPRMVVPVDNIRAARARLQRSTDAVPFGLYYNRRRSVRGL